MWPVVFSKLPIFHYQNVIIIFVFLWLNTSSVFFYVHNPLNLHNLNDIIKGLRDILKKTLKRYLNIKWIPASTVQSSQQLLHVEAGEHVRMSLKWLEGSRPVKSLRRKTWGRSCRIWRCVALFSPNTATSDFISHEMYFSSVIIYLMFLKYAALFWDTRRGREILLSPVEVRKTQTL